VGTGITFTVSGQIVSSILISTENLFGFSIGGTAGCIIAFAATGPATISGTGFQVGLELSSNAIPGIGNLAVASAASFTGTPTLQGTFSSATSASGQLSYNINSAACGGRTYIGVGSGYGPNTRSWTATRG
jgi:hypothetical protein